MLNQEDYSIAVFIVALALPAGCASTPPAKAPEVSLQIGPADYRPDEPYRSDPSLSAADNVFLAASRTVRSWPREDRVKNVRAPRGPHPTFGQRLGETTPDILFNSMGAASPTPGFGVVGTVIMAAAQSAQSLLVLAGVGNGASQDRGGNSPRPRSTSRIVFWMPHERATDTKDAWRKVETLWADALDAATSALRAPYVGRLEQRGYGLSYFDALGARTVLVVHGGECDRPEIACGYETMDLELPEIAAAPDFIGRGKVWVGAPSLRYSSIDRAREIHHDASSNLPDLAVYRAVSAHLPVWVYLYLSAGSVSLGDGNGLLEAPVMLHLGRILAFGKPKVKS